MIELLVRVFAAAAAAWVCKQVVVWLYRYYSTQQWFKTTSIPGPPATNKLIGTLFLP
jgi:hypothetical protein